MNWSCQSLFHQAYQMSGVYFVAINKDSGKNKNEREVGITVKTHSDLSNEVRFIFTKYMLGFLELKPNGIVKLMNHCFVHCSRVFYYIF